MQVGLSVKINFIMNTKVVFSRNAAKRMNNHKRLALFREYVGFGGAVYSDSHSLVSFGG